MSRQTPPQASSADGRRLIGDLLLPTIIIAMGLEAVLSLEPICILGRLAGKTVRPMLLERMRQEELRLARRRLFGDGGLHAVVEKT